jgi:hypothetical protein
MLTTVRYTEFMMNRIDYNDFYNDGFGFICKHCERELKEKQTSQTHKRPRYLREGEAESKQTTLYNSALAKWLDTAQTTLICPTCGLVEKID